jgi:uncharacterized protein YcbX
MEEGTKRKSKSTQLEVDPMRFRPNLIISGAEPYEEYDWHSVTVGNEHFIVCILAMLFSCFPLLLI